MTVVQIYRPSGPLLGSVLTPRPSPGKLTGVHRHDCGQQAYVSSCCCCRCRCCRC